MICNQNRRDYNDSGNDTTDKGPSSSQNLVVLASPGKQNKHKKNMINLGIKPAQLGLAGYKKLRMGHLNRAALLLEKFLVSQQNFMRLFPLVIVPGCLSLHGWPRLWHALPWHCNGWVVGDRMKACHGMPLLPNTNFLRITKLIVVEPHAWVNGFRGKKL